jgi:hypothetical protein
MRSAEQRIALVVRGVVEQALADAGVGALSLVGPRTPASSLIERWCGRTFQAGEPGLTVIASTKTELLLAGPAGTADLCPLGDLYASEVSWLAGVDVLAPELQDLAAQADGVSRLDASLRKLLDERRSADAAFAELPHIRNAVLMRLQKSRFRRARLGIVPKLGARTIGIDLHI